MIKNYGVDHNMKMKRCLDARKETYIKNWGVDNPTKNREILDKSLTNGSKIKPFRDTNIFYQGSYELDFLEKYYDKITIIKGISIDYYYENSLKKYHSDYFLPDFNTIVEIKSIYWYNYALERNITKKEFSLINHNYILILDKNYEEFDNLLKIKLKVSI